VSSTAAGGRGIKIKILENKNVQFKFKNIFSKDYLSFQCGLTLIGKFS
jgi:hypothetical protein